MKKTLLTLFSLAAFIICQATSPTLQLKSKDGIRLNSSANLSILNSGMEKQAPQFAAEKNEIRFCAKEAKSSLTLQYNGSLMQYIEIPKEMTKMYDGCEITTIVCGYGSGASNKKAVAFVTTDLKNFQYKQDFTFEGPAIMKNVELEQPYTIDGTKPLYIGYEASFTASDYPVLVDLQSPDCGEGLAGAVAVKSGSTIDSIPLSGEGFGNLVLYAYCTGELKDALIPKLEYITSLTYFQTCRPSEKVGFEFGLRNLGTIDIENATVTVSTDGNTPVEYTRNFALGNLQSDFLTVEHQMTEESGIHTMEVKLVKINGEDVNYQAYTPTFYVVPSDVNYQKRLLIEEFTGLWCGWCPAGIVGIDYMNENYSDSFIGIPVHVANGPTAPDKFQTDSYMPLVQKFIYSFPSMLVNRDLSIMGFMPDKGTLEYIHGPLMSTPAAADVKVNAVYDAKNPVKATCEVTFAADEENADYRIAFVVLEKDLRGMQQNYFSGGEAGEMGGWEDKAAVVNWKFSETARDIFDVWGINKSIPSSIKAGEPIKFDYDVKLTNVSKYENSVIVAMVIDNRTGSIINAAKTDYQSGVETVNNENAKIIASKGSIAVNGEFENAFIYNLAGHKMAQIKGNGVVSLPAGIYLVNVDGNVRKVIVR